MRILHTVESYLPLRHGMQEVVSRISEWLVKRGHEVTVATSSHPDRKEKLINGVRIEEFSLGGNMVEGYRGDAQEQVRYQRFLREGGFDVITNFAAQQWATDLALPILEKIPAKKVFVPTGFSALFLKRYQRYFSEMSDWMRRYDMNVFLSNTYRDARFADAHHIENRVLLPNGASEEEFLKPCRFSMRDRLGIPSDAFLILLVGSHSGMKGHREAVEIFDAAALDNAVLLIVANEVRLPSQEQGPDAFLKKMRRFLHRFRNECPQFCATAEEKFNTKRSWRERSKRMLIRDLSREETVCAYHEAELFLFPSRIECYPIVLFEAAASRTPFLATDVGNAAEIAEWTGGGLILSTGHDENGYAHADIAGSAQVLENLWRDRERRSAMTEQGYAAWRERFTWEKVAERYEQLYNSLLQRVVTEIRRDHAETF